MLKIKELNNHTSGGGMLCEFARRFPSRVADLLERDRGLTRNFREETITDVIMAGLIGLESFGIKVNFPDEPATGADMDWIYAAPREIEGGRYLRIRLQAKRAQFFKGKTVGYWFYHHLDHGDPRGSQAKTLVADAATSPGGNSTLPLYIFYHPRSALNPASGVNPAIDGINIVPASKVAPIVADGCDRPKKKVEYWRPHFLPFSDLLCWPVLVTGVSLSLPGATQFLIGSSVASVPPLTGGFHPDIVAQRFQFRLGGVLPSDDVVDGRPFKLEPANDIPEDIRRAISDDLTLEDRRQLKRPRVIFTTELTRDNPAYAMIQQRAREMPPRG